MAWHWATLADRGAGTYLTIEKPPRTNIRTEREMSISAPSGAVASTADPFPKHPDPMKPLMFVHIPRTAGFTLKTMLETIFGLERTLLDAHFYDTDTDDLRHYAVVEGHKATRYFAHQFGTDWNKNGLTLLREPVARTISYARLLRSQPEGKRNPPLKAKVRNPEELFGAVPVLSNQQTKMLAARGQDATSLDDAALEDAKAVLDRITFGCTESFERSLCLFAERFKLELPRLQAMNASPSSGDADLTSESFREQARLANDLDLQLYDYATALLERRVDEYVRALLDQELTEAPLTWRLKAGRDQIDHHIALDRAAGTVQVTGWMLVDGIRPDAVLARSGSETTPLTCRVFDLRAARSGDRGPVRNRFAGISGTVRIPAGAEEVEFLAFDRQRQLCGSRTVKLVRNRS